MVEYVFLVAGGRPAGTTTAPAANGPVQKLGEAIGFDRAYSYDGAGRLTQVADRTATATGTTVQPGDTTSTAVPCQVRSYVYDGTLGVNGNRTSSRVEDHSDGACTSTPTTSTTRSYAYDTADRAITGANGTGAYTYDPLGRVTTLPAADAPDAANGDVTLGYFDNDLPASVKQGTTDTAFTLDVQGRRLTQTTTGAGWPGATAKVVRHYTDGSDNPAWVDATDATTGAVTQTAFAESIAGDLGAQITLDGAATLTLANLHGDVVTTITLPPAQDETTPAVSITGWSDYTEFGTPRNPWATIILGGPAGYGWLGAKQRSTTLETAGLTLMGDRYYNPVRGQFTALDPEPGGNPNAYTYPLDPIGSYDLDGHWGLNFSKAWQSVVNYGRKHATALRRVGYVTGVASTVLGYWWAAYCQAASLALGGISAVSNAWAGDSSGLGFANVASSLLMGGRGRWIRSMRPRGGLIGRLYKTRRVQSLVSVGHNSIWATSSYDSRYRW